MNLKRQIEEIIHDPISDTFLSTGRISTASGKSYFLKTGAESTTYACEAHSLNEIAQATVIRTPQVIAVGKNFLITEYIENGYGDKSFFRNLGIRLAALHRTTTDQYGFYEDNYIGANPQPNLPTGEERTHWPAFYFNKRLLFQYRLAERNGYVTSELQSGFHFLEKHIEEILANSNEPPTLLHGDLWGGNFLCDNQGEPVLIDPAAYYGHREADLAMTRLFGGFSPAFYEAYQEAYPLQPGWEYRENIYKLYHILNHLNLFGRGYLSDAESLMNYYRIQTNAG